MNLLTLLQIGAATALTAAGVVVSRTVLVVSRAAGDDHHPR